MSNAGAARSAPSNSAVGVRSRRRPLGGRRGPERHRESAPLPRRVPALKRIEADVAIVGAGPAGAAAALALAGAHRRGAARPRRDAGGPDRRDPAGGRAWLLGALGLWEDFLSDGHSPCHARRSVWGGGAPITLDALCDPDGPAGGSTGGASRRGCATAAADRGALLLAPAGADRVTRAGAGWRIEAGGPKPARSRRSC